MSEQLIEWAFEDTNQLGEEHIRMFCSLRNMLRHVKDPDSPNAEFFISHGLSLWVYTVKMSWVIDTADEAGGDEEEEEVIHSFNNNLHSLVWRSAYIRLENADCYTYL